MGLRDHVPQSVAAEGQGGSRRFKRLSLWSAGGRSPSSLSQPSLETLPGSHRSLRATLKSAREGAAARPTVASWRPIFPSPLRLSSSLSMLSGAYHRVDSAMLRSALLSHLGLPPPSLGWGWSLYKSRLLGLAPPPQEKKKKNGKDSTDDNIS